MTIFWRFLLHLAEFLNFIPALSSDCGLGGGDGGGRDTFLCDLRILQNLRIGGAK